MATEEKVQEDLAIMEEEETLMLTKSSILKVIVERTNLILCLF